MKPEILEAVNTYAHPCPIEEEGDFTLQTFSGEERGMCLHFLYHLGARRGRSVNLTKAIHSLCISGRLPFEWIEVFYIIPSNSLFIGSR